MVQKEEIDPTQAGLLQKMIYADKKITKAQIREISIDVIMNSYQLESLSLKQASTLILALAKIISKRFRFLVDDCKHFLQLISKDTSTVAKTVRVPSSKGITLNIENGLVLVDDEMEDVHDQFIVPEFDKAILNDQPGFEIDFGDLTGIEQVRDSTVLSSGIFDRDSNINIALKKRRIIEDGITEIDETVFRGNLRAVSDILIKRPRGTSIEEMIKSRIQINSEISGIFNRIGEERMAIEAQRNPSFQMDDYDQPDFLFNPIDNTITDSFHDARFDVGYDSVFTGLDLSGLPKEFLFNSVVEQFNVSEKASHFFSLLSLATEGKILVEQNDPFSGIKCIQTND